MKRLVLAFTMVFLVAGVAGAKDFEVTKKAGDYTVVAKIDKNPPINGENNLTLDIKDAGGANVTDAKVKVEYSMPAMPGMPAMNYKTEAELKGSEYKAKLNFSMSGPWNVAVKISRGGGKTTQAKFTVDVR